MPKSSTITSILPPKRILSCLLLLSLLSACSTLQLTHRDIKKASPVCEQLFSQLNQSIHHEGVEDIQALAVEGYPSLRSNRFLASFQQNFTQDEASYWLSQLEALGLEGWGVEFQNLSSKAQNKLNQWSQEHFQNNIPQALETCQTRLHPLFLQHIKTIQAHASIPDDYQTWERAVGVYPVTALFFLKGVHQWHDEVHEKFNTPLPASNISDQHYSWQKKSPTTSAQISTLLQNSLNNPLSIPMPDAQQSKALFEHFAPQITILHTDPTDNLGSIEWNPQGNISVQGQPSVYTLISHTRFEGQILLQLNYVFWFPERKKTSSFDLLGGALDGLIWRVTLDHDGQPLIYDAIHPCGCYQMFFPTTQLRLKKQHKFYDEGALVPQVLTNSLDSDSSMSLMLESQTHMLLRVQATQKESGTHYRMFNYNDLRHLPYTSGYKSMFRSDGLVQGSERSERFFFWPMGVLSAGAMRQWGHHATEFVGRRHFDDAYLMERYFTRQIPRYKKKKSVP